MFKICNENNFWRPSIEDKIFFTFIRFFKKKSSINKNSAWHKINWHLNILKVLYFYICVYGWMKFFRGKLSQRYIQNAYYNLTIITNLSPNNYRWFSNLQLNNAFKEFILNSWYLNDIKKLGQKKQKQNKNKSTLRRH